MSFDQSILQRPEVFIPTLGFLALAVLASWAIFRATDRRTPDDEGIEEDPRDDDAT